MRNLAIAYGNSRQAKNWVNKTITYEELKERLKVTIRTPESVEEYAKFNKAKRDTVKDHGGFVAGALKGGRRKIDTVEFRSMIALDGDRIDKAFLEHYEENAPYTSLLYTTHSSTEENPRVRLLYPLTRDVTPEEFVAVSRYLAEMLGIDYFDECSYQPNQLMYWPSRPGIEGKTNEDTREVQTETLTIKATPLSNGLVKAKTGNTTDTTVYKDWYTAVYMPTDAKEESEGIA